tara:strand:+ start:6424 stop:7284 length:861 start_codon:yes stop_codon:yes gene_type:complete
MARRNNAGRLGSPEAPSDSNPPIPAVEDQTDSLFSFVTPTEFVDLPSGGEPYEEGHPLHNVKSIEIRHMTAKEEDILSSESLLKKGLALDRLLQSVLLDKRIKTDDLLVGDKNALLIATRITGFGPIYESTVTCPSCFASAAHRIDLDEIETKDPDLPPQVTLREDGYYDIFIEKYKLTVTVRLLKGGDEKRVTQQRDKRKKMKRPEANVTDQLGAIIMEVDGHSDRETIKHFIDVVPATISRQIRTVYDGIVPNLDLTVEYECETCSYEGRVGLPMTAEFFWPGA